MQDFQRTNFGAPHTNKHLGDSTSPKNFCKRKSPVVFVVHQFCCLNRVSERSTTPLVHCCCLLLLQCVFPPNICSGPVLCRHAHRQSISHRTPPVLTRISNRRLCWTSRLTCRTFFAIRPNPVNCPVTWGPGNKMMNGDIKS